MICFVCDDKTFKDRTSVIPSRLIRCREPLTVHILLSFILVSLYIYIWKPRCIDHVTLRGMIFKLPCNGLCCWCMHVRLCLESCVFCRVHDREPVLTEGGAVAPSEVSHQLENKERSQYRGTKLTDYNKSPLFFYYLWRQCSQTYWVSH